MGSLVALPPLSGSISVICTDHGLTPHTSIHYLQQWQYSGPGITEILATPLSATLDSYGTQP